MAEMSKNYSKIIAKAWSDEEFKNRLVSDPITVLKENGVDVGSVGKIEVVQNSKDVAYLVLPAKPAKELSDADMEQIAGGKQEGPLGDDVTICCSIACCCC